MASELQAAEPDLVEAGPVRRLPESAAGRSIEPWSDVGTAALAVAGGVVAGAATVAVVKAAARSARRAPRRRIVGRRKEKVVASRSFLIDVHLLGR
ncbi:MAG: hypothetical protein EXQ70_05155 [Solirubrobacterales bacterium]|nr:hypothetical protein [Solirubrobacterales bacterium]